MVSPCSGEVGMACEGGDGESPCSGEVGVTCTYESVLKTKCISI